MKMMNRYGKVIAMSAAALAMTAALSVEGAMAYFTTYTEAGGSGTVSLGPKTEIDEDVSEMTKHVTITNTSDNECFVRVKVFSGMDVKCTPTGTNWKFNDDGYWYYQPIVAPGEKAEVLDVKIEYTGAEPQDFNVVVVQECTPVIYDEGGNATADWDAVVYSSTGEEADN